MKAVPTRGADSIWFRLAAAAQQLKEEIEPTLIQRIALEKWTETLLDAAAHPNEIIRNHAVAALEKMGELALDAALERAEALNLSWFEERKSWPGAPSWRIDLWAAISALHPTLTHSPHYQIPELIEKLESPETRAHSIQDTASICPSCPPAPHCGPESDAAGTCRTSRTPLERTHSIRCTSTAHTACYF